MVEKIENILETLPCHPQRCYVSYTKFFANSLIIEDSIDPFLKHEKSKKIMLKRVGYLFP